MNPKNPSDDHQKAKLELNARDFDNRKNKDYRTYKDDFDMCEACGKKESDLKNELEVHHLLPVRYDNDYENDRDNLIALCDICHATADSHRHIAKDRLPSEEMLEIRFNKIKEASQHKRSKMIEKINQEGKDLRLTKILMYEGQV